MVIAYITIGMVVGFSVTLAAILAGTPIWLAILIYSVSGSLGTLCAAMVLYAVASLRPRLPHRVAQLVPNFR